MRYDYNYSEEELLYWKEKLAKVMKKVKAGYVFFNNCHLGQAARNASQFAEMIAEPDG